MAIIVKPRPKTPGQRQKVSVKHPELYKGRPFQGLVESKLRTNGRNCYGRITVRHRGGGHKKLYRIMDFKRDKDGIVGVVERLEYDPNRSAHIALVLYKDGERRYIVAPKGLTAGNEVMSGSGVAIQTGNSLPLREIPVGTTIHCVELKPGAGAQLIRSAGASAQLAAKEGIYATLKMRSGEMRKVLLDCRACIGEVSNMEHNLIQLGKAGAARWRGRRPTV
ncbi:MAG TPA: 50S ribosomal protein L2, partial [Flavobacteriales bacterium]|nr:50S ribosomal protein L2 [Flavobacteriales bacterium]